MQFTNYLSACLISYLGLLAGILLVKIAPEEQKPLAKYFELAGKILLVAIFAFAFFYYLTYKFYLLVFILYFAFSLLAEYKISDVTKKSIINYTLLGILFFLGSKNLNLFTIESCLIFLYGLILASVIYDKKEKNEYKILFYNFGFVIIASLLFFI